MHKTNLNKLYKGRLIGLLTGLILFMLLIWARDLQAQIQWGKESLTRGKVWMTITNSFRLGEVDLPWTYYTLDYPGYSTGADLSDKLTYIIAGGYVIYGEREGVAKAYTINGVFYASSKYVYPTENAELIQNYNFLVDPTLPAEEIVTGAHHVIDLDVDVAIKNMVWSYPKYDDFVIHKFTITNTGSTTLSNIHFGTRLGCWTTMKGTWLGPGDYYDDKYGWSDAHDCFYIYDDWSFRWEDESLVDFPYDFGTGDIGDPADIEAAGARVRELLSPGYLTSICLDPADGNVYQNILEYLGQGTSSDAPSEDFMVRLGTDIPSRFLEVMTHQQPRMSWDDAKSAGGEGGNKFERFPELVVSCGPNELAPGNSVTVVFAEVLGEMDRAKIVAGGVDNVNLLATASRDSLLANVEACRDLYANGYQIANHPPMTPTDGENSLELKPVGGGVEITWPPIPDTYTDPVSGINDFAGYKVYRSSYFCIGPWTLVETIPKADVNLDPETGNVVYTETDLPLGVGVYYTVTSYDTDGNESGKVNANRFPVYPLRSPNLDFPKKVYVVPNPFRQHSKLMGAGEELRMEFIGLPAKCTISIYTMAGELVREIEHEDGSGSEAWGSVMELDYQVNKWMMYVAPGVYVYLVESNVPGQEGETYIGKFAIIK